MISYCGLKCCATELVPEKMSQKTPPVFCTFSLITASMLFSKLALLPINLIVSHPITSLYIVYHKSDKIQVSFSNLI